MKYRGRLGGWGSGWIIANYLPIAIGIQSGPDNYRDANSDQRGGAWLCEQNSYDLY